MLPAATAYASLGSGAKCPLLGLGTYKIRDQQTISTVIDTALGCGYRLIDTAAVYKNEEAIGNALKELRLKHELQPEELFITSKLAPCDHGYERTLTAFESSLLALQRPSLDLYLIHWPGAQGRKKEDPQNAVLRRESWMALEELYKIGKVKAIGVSNYSVNHLEELRQYATILPHLLQSECHPWLVQKELRSYCREQGIFFQAYSSLGNGKLLQNDIFIEVARHYQKTPSQLLLRWALQHGIAVIPKAANPVHVQENAAVFDFEITHEDMDSLNCLDKGHHFAWDPTDVA